MKSGANRDGKQKVNKRESTARAKSTAVRRRAPGKNSKHIGDLAELDFMLQAASRGFPVAKPFGDNEHYDVMVGAGSRIWRVQVRSTSRHHCRGYAVRAFWRRSDKNYFAYTPGEIDFLAAFIRSPKIWYIIPVRALQGRLGFDLYPFGCRRDGRRPFEKYREAWYLLTPGSRPKFAPSPEGRRLNHPLALPAGG